MSAQFQCPKCLARKLTFREAERCYASHGDKTPQEIRTERKP